MVRFDSDSDWNMDGLHTRNFYFQEVNYQEMVEQKLQMLYKSQGFTIKPVEFLSIEIGKTY